MSFPPAAGDRDAAWFEEMFRAQHGVVLTYARRRVIDADDVVSEVFAAAWRRRAELPDPVVGWLLRAASNYVLHDQRSRGRRAALTARSGGSGHVDDHADAVISRHDAGLLINGALAALSPADQELLRLAVWEQLTHDQLAYVTGCAVATVRVRLHRARRRLEREVLRSQRTLAKIDVVEVLP